MAASIKKIGGGGGAKAAAAMADYYEGEVKRDPAGRTAQAREAAEAAEATDE